MSPWSINPAWQNFSSMYREAQTSAEAKTEMERHHHLTAALYFGATALEAFLNSRMREHMKDTHSEEEILKRLRWGKIAEKLSKWPSDITGNRVEIAPETSALLDDLMDIRHDLTHPKTTGHDIYERLETVRPTGIVSAVAEYIVRYHEAAGSRYPYWVFGWNYLNPARNSYEIFLINDQQFLFSLVALGFKVPSADYGQAEAWFNDYFRSFERYSEIRDALQARPQCEPKWNRFPFKPVLCRRWWTAEHHRSCGNVTNEALARAKNYDGSD
jgi:hypothetical protein